MVYDNGLQRHWDKFVTNTKFLSTTFWYKLNPFEIKINFKRH